MDKMSWFLVNAHKEIFLTTVTFESLSLDPDFCKTLL